MKKVLLMFLFLVPISIFGQAEPFSIAGGKRNLLMIKINYSFFKGDEIKNSWYSALFFYPDIAYRRYFKKKQLFFESEFDNVIETFHSLDTMNLVGKKTRRRQNIFDGKIGAYLIVTPRISCSFKAGVAYRLLGRETIIATVRYRPGTYIVESAGLVWYPYNDFGATASFEVLYRYGKRWHVSLEAGGERFFHRKILTKERFWTDLGIGFAF